MAMSPEQKKVDKDDVNDNVNVNEDESDEKHCDIKKNSNDNWYNDFEENQQTNNDVRDGLNINNNTNNDNPFIICGNIQNYFNNQ